MVSRKKNRKKDAEFSKRLISDIRVLLWVVTVGGLALAFVCVLLGYVGELAWITAMVGLPWAAHGTVCAFYLEMAKSDHSNGDGTGITFAMAEANGFVQDSSETGNGAEED